MNARSVFVVLWIALTASAAAFALFRQWSSATAAFERDVGTLHRAVSQRVDQHDAHLTALSALVQSGDGPAGAALKAVSANIAQFYPRIVGIDVVSVRGEPVVLASQRQQTNAPLELIAQAARGASGRTELVSAPSIDGRYLLVKRVPSPEARLVVSLEIDARRLLELDDTPAFRKVVVRTSAAGAPAYEAVVRREQPPFGWARLSAEKVVASASQPLHLTIDRDVTLLRVFPWSAVLAASLAFGSVLFLLRVAQEHRAAERTAVAKAAASDQEARLAHASRINAMGELSLAVAHELAQPLAALLSQSQAGLRIAKSREPDPAALIGVLEANARLAKRAGDLLCRLRGWISVDPPELQAVDLNRVMTDIAALNRAEFARRGLSLTLDLAASAPVAAADPVGIEQVIQNLIANARDAAPSGTTVTVATTGGERQVGFSVTDQGPGLAPEIRSRLFEPFLTSKPDGMGLGLSISRRLIEKFGGRIHGGNRADGRPGAHMVVELPTWSATLERQVDQRHGAALPDR